MATIAENLQTLIDQKAAIKASLENQGKEPTEELGTYAELIDTLENPDEVTYCVTVDGENKKYAQLYRSEKVTLTATANDIRIDTSAITDTGYTEGTKDIPVYHSRYGKKILLSGKEAVISNPEYDYKELMASIATYNSSTTDSVSVQYSSVDNALYEAKTTTKVSDITKDSTNLQINLGTTVSEKSVLRYFVTREEI